MAAPVRQADDDAVDVVFGDEPIDVGGGADDAGVDDALADPGGVAVDEADDAIGELVLIEDLARDLARACRRCRRTGAAPRGAASPSPG